MLWAEVGCVASDGIFSLCQLDTCKCVVLFFMYICKCSLMPFMYVLFVKILSYVEEIKNIYLASYSRTLVARTRLSRTLGIARTRSSVPAISLYI